MVPNRIRFSLAVPILVLACLAARPAFAGPPLLCHPFDIDGARSLPWDGSSSWFAGRADYDLSNLVTDTEALLAPQTPVIVRMETLRRAAIYASRDQKIAARLLSRLVDRARNGDRSGHADPLTYMDAAYITEALRQIGMLERMAEFRTSAPIMRELVAGADGYVLAQKSISLRPGDPSLEFAAALIASQSNRAAYQAHAERARAGAKQDALLARNLKQLT